MNKIRLCNYSSYLLGLAWLLMLVSSMSYAGGKFILVLEKSEDKNVEHVVDFFKKDKKLTQLIKKLNQKYQLPQDVMIRLEDDEDIHDPEGPFYDEDKREISLSYQYISEIGDIYFKYHLRNSKKKIFKLSDLSPKKKKVFLGYVLRVTQFDLLHEVGHMLIDIYDIPVLGNEEEACDNLAVIFALEYLSDGFNIVLDEAESYQDSNEEYAEETEDYWDEHNLDLQRYYDILCMLYGRRPNRLIKEIATWNDVDAINFLIDRNEFCHDEYLRQKKAWFKLLKPHMQN